MQCRYSLQNLSSRARNKENVTVYYIIKHRNILTFAVRDERNAKIQFSYRYEALNKAITVIYEYQRLFSFIDIYKKLITPIGFTFIRYCDILILVIFRLCFVGKTVHIISCVSAIAFVLPLPVCILL